MRSPTKASPTEVSSARREFIRWSELRSVRYATRLKWFRLESNMLMELPELASRLLKRAPESSIHDKTLPVLQETAKGNPPSIWG